MAFQCNKLSYVTTVKVNKQMLSAFVCSINHKTWMNGGCNKSFFVTHKFGFEFLSCQAVSVEPNVHNVESIKKFKLNVFLLPMWPRQQTTMENVHTYYYLKWIIYLLSKSRLHCNLFHLIIFTISSLKTFLVIFPTHA